MRALIQRVTSARVSIHSAATAEIGAGLVILLGIGVDDTADHAKFLAEKIAHLRIFEDSSGKFNLSLLEAGGQALVVSQFTLYADTRKGRRPSFTEAAQPEKAAPLVEAFISELVKLGIPCQTGVFGEHMLVEINNDGPVTIWLDK